MIRVAILVAVAALAGCEEKRPSEAGSNAAMAKMKEFRDAMCACKDKRCADQVQDGVTKWSYDMGVKADRRSDDRPSEAMTMKMTEVGQAYAECMTAAMTPSEPPATPSPPPKSDVPARVASPATVEQLLAAAREWSRGEHDQLRIVALDASYIDADGVVDAEHGIVAIVPGGSPPGDDDPKRRTGAPVKRRPSQPTTCMEVSWTAAKGWTREWRSRCLEAAVPFPRCTVPVIWKRAIAKGVPADALAVLRLKEGTPRQWLFSITDEPRKIDINYLFEDDCELAVEKP